jgi:plastocyanin
MMKNLVIRSISFLYYLVVFVVSAFIVMRLGHNFRAFAETERTFDLVIKGHKMNPEVIEVAAGEKFQIKVTNQDKSFEEFESKSLNIEKFLKPGATVTVFVGPLQPGEYDYFAEFHASTGKGKIVVKGLGVKP